MAAPFAHIRDDDVLAAVISELRERGVGAVSRVAQRYGVSARVIAGRLRNMRARGVEVPRLNTTRGSRGKSGPQPRASCRLDDDAFLALVREEIERGSGVMLRVARRARTSRNAVANRLYALRQRRDDVPDLPMGGPGKRHSPLYRAIMLRREGYPDHLIAEVLGRDRSTVSKWLRMVGERPNKRGPATLTDVEREEIIGRALAGEACRRIAEATGRSEQTVASVLRGADIDPAERASPRWTDDKVRALKRYHRRGWETGRIARALGVPYAAAWKALKRRGLEPHRKVGA